VVRDAPAGLAPAEAMAVEGRRILDKAGPADFLVVLDEGGEALRSVDLAQRLRAWTEAPATVPCFVVGGAHGLGAEVLAAARVRLALGPMTLPHELARVLLLEQLYRAASILRQLPYHHA
jgi:23S rRNA (pseudouridine1915-N3)-methyltransferase